MELLDYPTPCRLNSKTLSFGLITPSYAPDFDRCRLLCETKKRFLPDSVNHYIVVDRRDVPLFRELGDRTTEILVVEEILPWWIQRFPFSHQGWLSLKTLPVRNWILQQLIKLSMAEVISEDMIGFVDSDVAFVRPFDYQNFIQTGQVRLYREPNSIPGDWKTHRRWYQTATKLLDCPPVHYPAPNFIGDLVTWKRHNVLKLRQYLESRFSKSWIETLANTLHWSEYILYGLFVEHILGEQAGHYYDEVYPGLQYFSTKPMSEPEICNFLADIQPQHVTVMISAKAGIPVQRYEKLLRKIR
ncbi:MAG: hypothetical protein HC929_13400 [Leptolyngbyaceae cyanobacterium SM2_5_2]|nr:hypothetical protein [Leptolyngbyaceae cyanobacterium SM2_5_2]